MILCTLAALASAICLLFLVLTDLDMTQRLLLAGVVLFEWAATWDRSYRWATKN